MSDTATVAPPSGEKCPCGSGRAFADCCGPYIAGTRQSPTAEALMRSRYSAYVKHDVDYIIETCAPTEREEEKISVKETRKWAEESTWLGLEIVSVEKGGAGDDKGVVEFKAFYERDGRKEEHHEKAQFERQGRDKRWYYASGKMVVETVRRESPKVGRNDPCPCGSGKKYKHCHGRSP